MIKNKKKDLVKERTHPFYFTHKGTQSGSVKNLDSHHINHIYSNLTLKAKLLEVEKLHVNNIVKEMADKNARIVNQ